LPFPPALEAMAPSNGKPLPRPAPGAVFKRLPEGGVLFSSDSEVYFGVDLVGARIWEMLPPVTQTVEEMVDQLAAQYRDVAATQIRSDVDRFLDELLANGLVAAVSQHPPRNPPVS